MFMWKLLQRQRSDISQKRGLVRCWYNGRISLQGKESDKEKDQKSIKKNAEKIRKDSENEKINR
jgi:hypothetical protein